MKLRTLLSIITLTVLHFGAVAANVQIKDLPATTSAASTDILALEIDVTGTMRTRKMTLGNLAINLDPQLTAIANSIPTADSVFYWTGLTTGSVTPLSAFGRTLIDDVDASAAKLTLGLSAVENVALSTWVGTSNITTVGTVAAGTWSAGVISQTKGGAGTVSGLLKADGAGVVSEAILGRDFEGTSSSNRNLQSLALTKSITSIAGVSTGISGVTYNPRTNTVFLVRNVSGAAGTIYESTLDGVILRTITNSNFIDTESIEYITSFKSAAGQVYDVIAVGEEDHTTAANENQITLCLLTPTATTLDRTAVNGTDPDNVTTTTAYSGGTINNLGLESLAYDSRRGSIYYTIEKRTTASDNTPGAINAKIFQRSITANSTTLAFGAESQLCVITPLFSGTLTDISDATYDAKSDTILLLSDESDVTVRISLAGALIETLSTPATQPEGLALHPDSDMLVITGEPQEFYRYEQGIHRGQITTVSTYGAGTAYAVTAISTAVDLGTTDPVVVIPAPGTYKLKGQVVLNYSGATFAANQAVTVKLRRTNNTAADVIDSSVIVTTGVVTTVTGNFAIVSIPEVNYSTLNSTDSITIFAGVAVVPSAGALQVTAPGTYIRAEKLY
jgi:uncharacterized protein YjiK